VFPFVCTFSASAILPQLLTEVIHIKILDNALFFPAVVCKDWRQNKLCGRTQEDAMSSAYQPGVCAAETY